MSVYEIVMEVGSSSPSGFSLFYFYFEAVQKECHSELDSPKESLGQNLHSLTVLGDTGSGSGMTKIRILISLTSFLDSLLFVFDPVGSVYKAMKDEWISSSYMFRDDTDIILIPLNKPYICIIKKVRL
ncbi:MAG: hypothetical protein U5K72_18075 [Balneolaceae bacterium]|nr:hypothetical protein [Balneolaceae bacterium]